MTCPRIRPIQSPGEIMDENKLKRLSRLGALRDSGALTEDEFKAQKAQVLGTKRPAAEASPIEAKLSRIEALRHSGALSDAEAAAEKSKLLRPEGVLRTAPQEAKTATASTESLVPTWAAKRKKPEAPVALIAGLAFLCAAIVGGAWWWSSKEAVRRGQGDVYVITGIANARTAPTTEFSSVVETLSAGDRVRGQWVGGRNGSRWLETSGEPKTYIWEGNLRLD